jgi:hypothetical protein
MITQEPTLNTIDATSGQYLIQFALTATNGDATAPIVLPGGLGSFSGSSFPVNFQGIRSPTTGNLPNIRTLMLSLTAQQITADPIVPSNIFLVNGETGQTIALYPPALPFGSRGVILGAVPFFMRSTQTLFVYFSNGAAGFSDNIGYTLSVSALSFEVPAYMQTMGYEAFNPPSGTTQGVLPVEIVPGGGTGIVDVNVVNQPIDVTLTNPLPFGASGIRLPFGTDLNGQTAGGIFVCTAPINSPIVDQDFTVMVIPTDIATYCTQMAWQNNDFTEVSSTYVRQLRGGIWSVWQLLNETPASEVAQPIVRKKRKKV